MITADDIREAQEQLILRRETHLDQLADKLQEDRVRRVVEPLLSGAEKSAFSARDLEYVRDLGMIAEDDPLRIANPIYAEVVPLVVFDRREGRRWADKVFHHRQTSRSGIEIDVWGM